MKLNCCVVAFSFLMTIDAAKAEPARAVICLDQEFKVGTVRELRIPRNSIFRNHGPITGDISGSWHVGDPQKSRNAAIVTTDDVVLSKAKRCAEAHVRMFVDGILNEEATARVTDSDYWAIDDVLDYVPGHKPAIEFGKLVDDMAVLAQLRSDVSDALTVPRPQEDDQAQAAKCLAKATSLAAHIGGALGRQTSSVVFIGHSAAQDVSLSCEFSKPTIFVAWDKRAKPAAETMQLIAKSGSIFTGAKQDEIKTLVNDCIAAALKPESNELASEEYDGVRADCQSFTRDGAAGSVAISRRLGPYPSLLAPSPAALRDLDRATEKLRASARKQSNESAAFTQWWLDQSVPSTVKSTLMIITRMQAPGERCPTWNPPKDKITTMMVAAGIKPRDIIPGGRYSETYAMLATAMREGTRDESTQEACETVQKYGRD